MQGWTKLDILNPDIHKQAVTNELGQNLLLSGRPERRLANSGEVKHSEILKFFISKMLWTCFWKLKIWKSGNLLHSFFYAYLLYYYEDRRRKFVKTFSLFKWTIPSSGCIKTIRVLKRKLICTKKLFSKLNGWSLIFLLKRGFRPSPPKV